MRFWPFGGDAGAAAERVEPTLPVPDAPRNAISSSQLESWADLWNGTSAVGGRSVSRDMAMRSSAVYACVQLLGGLLAILPLPIYRRDGDERAIDRDHQVYKLLNKEPNATYFPALFKAKIMEDRLLGGDHFSRIERTPNGVPKALHPLDPRQVTVDKTGGRLIYVVTDDESRKWTLDQDDMFHVPSVGFNGRRSLTPIQYAARSGISIQLSADEFSEKYFDEGIFAQLKVEAPGKMGEEQQEALREYVKRKMAGSQNGHTPLVLTEGLKLDTIGISAEDAQLMETRNFQIHDIARVFGVAPHMIGATDKQSNWGTGIEQQQIGFVMFSLQRHLAFIEQEVNRKLVRNKNYYAEFNLEGILRGDSKARSDFYRQAIGGSMGPGWMTINEVRRKDNLPPIEGGEELYIPATGGADATSDQNSQQDTADNAAGAGGESQD